MTERQEKLLTEIMENKSITCFHAIDQPLVNELVSMIIELRGYQEKIENSDILGEDN